ncbi:hypothetical protein, partial [Bradyrhizobium sp.]|uniref:hypothetical protein n=1 Tax=Bradyrhizobium sp. TaxID=376 RepID=UPI0025C04635
QNVLIKFAGEIQDGLRMLHHQTTNSGTFAAQLFLGSAALGRRCIEKLCQAEVQKSLSSFGIQRSDFAAK